jgi:class 3 adenylate cyclase
MGLAPGQFLGSFSIGGVVGRGSMGTVYRARDGKLGREVALKVLSRGFVATPGFVERFIREAKLLASLNHPSIASLYDFQKIDDLWFLVMELVEGETLAERLGRGRMPVGEALATFGQVSEALASAHAKGVIHRDLKPSNLKFTLDGRIKVIDFGIARLVRPEAEGGDEDEGLTRVGSVIGTPAYMSPEQACGMKVDARSDIWSWGCCLFEALVGERLFRGTTPMGLVAQIVSEAPDWSRLPADAASTCGELLRRCLAKAPEERPATMVEVREALGEIASAGRGERETEAKEGPTRTRFRAFLAMRAGGEVDLEDCAEAIAEGVERFAGEYLMRDGEGAVIGFNLPSQALLSGLAMQRRLKRPGGEGAGIGMGVHAAEIKPGAEGRLEMEPGRRAGGLGVALELAELAGPGQILMSAGVYPSCRSRLNEGPYGEQVAWLDHGEFEFRRIGEAIRVYEAGIVGLSRLKPPRPTAEARVRAKGALLSVAPLSRPVAGGGQTIERIDE